MYKIRKKECNIEHDQSNLKALDRASILTTVLQFHEISTLHRLETVEKVPAETNLDVAEQDVSSSTDEDMDSLKK